MPSVVHFADEAKTMHHTRVFQDGAHHFPNSLVSDSSSAAATLAPQPCAGVGHVSLSAKCPARFFVLSRSCGVRVKIMSRLQAHKSELKTDG